MKQFSLQTRHNAGRNCKITSCAVHQRAAHVFFDVDETVCRKVPLSEGRVHNNTLECAYHGWEFDGSGKLVVIPQAWSL